MKALVILLVLVATEAQAYRLTTVARVLEVPGIEALIEDRGADGQHWRIGGASGAFRRTDLRASSRRVRFWDLVCTLGDWTSEHGSITARATPRVREQLRWRMKQWVVTCVRGGVAVGMGTFGMATATYTTKGDAHASIPPAPRRLSPAAADTRALR